MDSLGIFSFKSAFAWLRRDNSPLVNYPAKCIWKLSIPVKIKLFTWLLVLGKISVHGTLQKRDCINLCFRDGVFCAKKIKKL